MLTEAAEEEPIYLEPVAALELHAAIVAAHPPRRRSSFATRRAEERRQIGLAGASTEIHKVRGRLGGAQGYRRLAPRPRHAVAHNAVGLIMRELAIKGRLHDRSREAPKVGNVTLLDLVATCRRRRGSSFYASGAMCRAEW